MNSMGGDLSHNTDGDSVSASSESTDASAFHTKLLSWDGVDGVAASVIWSTLKSSVDCAASMVNSCLELDTSNPEKMKKLVLHNEPGLASLCTTDPTNGVPADRLGSLSLSIALFDLVVQPNLPVLGAVLCQQQWWTKFKDGKQKIGKQKILLLKEKISRLVWQCNTLLLFFPERFPNLIAARESHAILLASSRNKQAARDLRPLGPMMAERFKVLPVENHAALLNLFCYNNRGFHYDRCLQRDSRFPSTITIFEVLDAVEKHYELLLPNIDGGWEKRHTIGLDVAQSICHEVHGVEPLFWAHCNNKKSKSLSLYRRHRQSVLDFHNNLKEGNMQERRKAALEYLHSLESSSHDDIPEEGEPSGDEMSTLDVLDEDIQAWDVAQEKQLGDLFSSLTVGVVPKKGVVGGVGAKGGSRKKKNKKAAVINFPASVKMDAARAAALFLCERFNNSGMPLDRQLASGKLLWKRAGGPENGVWEKHDKLQMVVQPLGDGGAPCIFHISNAFSPEFLARDWVEIDKTPMCTDTNSGGGTSLVGVFFCCRNCPDGAAFMGPLFKVGQNSVASVPAPEWMRLKQDMATELVSLFIDATNQILAGIRNRQSHPETNVAPAAPEPVSTEPSPPLSQEDVEGLVGKLLQSFPVDEIEKDDIQDLPPQRCNTNCDKGGRKAVFSSHQDSSFILNSTNSNSVQCAANGDRLPLREEMPVITFVTTLGDCDAKLIWHRKGHQLASVVTTSNTVHGQLAGVQWHDVEHKSELVGKAGHAAPNSNQLPIRYISTYRMTACPRCDGGYPEGIRLDGLGVTKRDKVWRKYNRVGLSNGISSFLLGADEKGICDGLFESDQQLSPAPGIGDNRWNATKMKEIAPRKFRRFRGTGLDDFLKEPRWDSSGNSVRPIVRPPLKLGLKEKSRATLCRHRRIVSTALEAGAVVDIVDNDGQRIMDQPLFLDPGPDNNLRYEQRTPLIPGQRLLVSSLPVTHTKMAKEVVNPNNPAVIVLVHAYKNDPESCRLWRRFAIALNKLGEKHGVGTRQWATAFEQLYRENNHLCELICNGFAGSMQKADANAPTATDVGRDDPQYVTGHPQSISNKDNAVMERLKEERRVVAVFLCETSWGERWEDNLADLYLEDLQSRDSSKRHKTRSGAPAARTGDESENESSDAEDDSDGENSLAGKSEKIETWEAGLKKPARRTKQEKGDLPSLFLGYFYIERKSENIEWTKEQVKSRFWGMPYYRKMQKVNLSHLRENFFEYHLKPAFTMEQVRTFAEWKQRDLDNEPLRRVLVWEGDMRPFTISVDRNQDVTDLPQSAVLDHISNEMPKKDFLEELATKQDENTKQYLSRSVFANSLKLQDAVSVILHVANAGNMRFERKLSVETMDGGETRAIPLVGPESDLLPDPLRLAPLPAPNADYDCVFQFGALQAKRMVEHIYSQTNITIDGDSVLVSAAHRPPSIPGKAALKWTHPESAINQYMLSQVIFMLILNRFTGATQVISRYEGHPIHGGTHGGTTYLRLPCMSQATDFGNFLWAAHSSDAFNSFISKQHKGSLPGELHETKRLIMMVAALANSSKGCKGLGKFFATKRSRSAMLNRLMVCIAHCGDLQGTESSELGFTSNKVLSDLERVFSGLVPAFSLELDRLVFGWGSTNGILCLLFPGETSDNPMDKTAKAKAFHVYLEGCLIQHPVLAAACGWKVEDGVLVSEHSGVAFSYIDTEHALCKIWLAVLHSHAARNISDSKHIFVAHCYPLCEKGEWEDAMKKEVSEMLQAFRSIKTKGEHPYPADLMFDEERKHHQENLNKN